MQRILIVEDNDELRSYLVSLLSPQYYVQACCNGREALVIVKRILAGTYSFRCYDA